MADAPPGHVDTWESVASGWERQRDLFARATTALSERMVELLAPTPGDRIIELAAGPGELGFSTLTLILPGGELVTTDAAPAMVDVARRRADHRGLTGVRFAVEDVARLSLEDASADGILCRFGLMLVPEMERAAGEIARVLRPGGRAVLAVWASSRLNPWMTAVGSAGLDLEVMPPPDPEAPGPFRLAGHDRVTSVVTAGGLDVVGVEDAPVTWEALSLDEWWAATCDMSPTLRGLLEQLPPDTAAALRRGAEAHLAEYVSADGALTVPGLAHIVVATRDV